MSPVGWSHDAVCVADYEHLARFALTQPVWGYINGGAGDELTLQANIEAFRRVGLRPRVLVDVSRRSAATKLLGSDVGAPIGIAPMAYHGLAHPVGELGTARAAGAEGVLLIVSTFASSTLEEIAAAAGGPLWFQVYCFRDRFRTAGLVRRAEAAGYRAVVLTVDCPLLGRRERDVRSRFTLPAHVTAVNLGAEAEGLHRARSASSAVAELTSELIDPTLSWADLDWIRSISTLPLVLKGITSAADAERAAAAGVDGVIVSNHGGRQLDGTVATLDVLPEVAQAVVGRCEVLVDGGVRRGADVLKALALGARAVLVGRPVLWGLAAGGEAGVTDVLRMLKAELDLAMALCGHPVLGEIGPSLVRWTADAGPQAAKAALWPPQTGWQATVPVPPQRSGEA